jgi:amino acid adenylation domain-containing protein/thioester reductase-like protein
VIPIGGPAAPLRPEQRGRRELTWSPDFLQRVERLAAGAEAPNDAVFVGAAAALLARYGNRRDVSLAYAIDGRVLAVRTTAGEEPQSRDLVRRVAAALADALPLDGVPFEHPVPGCAHATVVLTRDAGDAAPDADLTISLGPGSLSLHFGERFDALAVDRMTEHLRAMVVGLVDGARGVEGLSIVGAEERAWILARSNATTVRLDETPPNVVERFVEHALARPDAIAVVDGDRELTYLDLDRASTALRDRLRVDPGDRVAVYLERGGEAVVAFLAILKARATYVPVDLGYPAGRVAAIAAAAKPRVVVTRAAHAAAFGAAVSSPPPSVFVDDEQPPVASPAARSAVSLDDGAYAFFTSGSTGEPKGVLVDHRALANYVRASSEAYGVRAADRVLQSASLGFDLSLEEIVVTLASGAALIVRSPAPIESVQGFVRECVDRGVTVLSITSALWHELTMRLADGSVTLPPRVRLVVLGADVARPDVLALWRNATGGRVRLVNSYGLTETTIVATTWEDAGEELSDWRALPIGRPFRNVSTYVLDATGQLSPVGVPGEICVGGLAVARGYLGDAALTASRFVADPFLPGARMYRTGDRGVLRGNGELEFLGREDHQLKVNGVRVELGEIEARLRELPGLLEGVVVPRKNSAGEIELEAYVIASSNDVTPARVHEHLERALHRATLPARIQLLDRFPLTTAGKIDRRALGAAWTARPPRADFVPPRSELEEQVTATVAEVLGIARVGLGDGFAALGGGSLAAVRAASLLERRLGRRVRSYEFFRCPTLGEVCVALESPRDEHVVAREALERDAVLEQEITPRRAPGPAPLESVLLTGATGFYGTFLLADLLRETRAAIVCVVRAPSREAARDRVLGALVRRGCAVDPAFFLARVSVEPGDVARPDLGLAPETFHALSESVDTIVHAAAQVNTLLPYASLRPSNVTGVRSVLRLATTRRPKTLHHVSTVEVLCDAEAGAPGALSERRAGPPPGSLASGYGQSKWVAERLVESARERGLRAFIHRPGRLTAHSRTGAFNDDDFLVRLLDACGRIGAAPALDVPVDMTPVDCASRALVTLARSQASAEVFHLVHPDTLRWSTLLDVVARAGYPLDLLPVPAWHQRLGAAASGERATFAHYLTTLSRGELEASLRGGYESTATRAAVGPDFAWPALDARLVSTALRAMVRSGRFSDREPT